MHPADLIEIQPILTLTTLHSDDCQRLELPPSRFARLFQIAPSEYQQRRLDSFGVFRLAAEVKELHGSGYME